MMFTNPMQNFKEIHLKSLQFPCLVASSEKHCFFKRRNEFIPPSLKSNHMEDNSSSKSIFSANLMASLLARSSVQLPKYSQSVMLSKYPATSACPKQISVRLGNKKVDEYIKKFKGICDGLYTKHKLVDEDSKVINFARGLVLKYKTFRNVMLGKTPYPTLNQWLGNALRGFDMREDEEEVPQLNSNMDFSVVSSQRAADELPQELGSVNLHNTSSGDDTLYVALFFSWPGLLDITQVGNTVRSGLKLQEVFVVPKIAKNLFSAHDSIKVTPGEVLPVMVNQTTQPTIEDQATHIVDQPAPADLMLPTVDNQTTPAKPVLAILVDDNRDSSSISENKSSEMFDISNAEAIGDATDPPSIPQPTSLCV
ncbi:hypothetical protein FXO37_09079 [Capsicum annuum]|nr:hypothetical protein FXO37_09079 [Capsicum annuum]